MRASTIKFIMLLLMKLMGLSLQMRSREHLLIAEIAKNILTKSELGQRALSWSREILHPYSEVCGEKYYPFVEAATWAGKIKQQNWRSMDDWHYIYIFGGNSTVCEKNYKNSPEYTSENLVWAINQCITHLVHSEPPQMMGSGKPNPILGLSIDLRILLHLVGNIHSSLNTFSFCDAKTFPFGDQRGRLWPVFYPKNVLTNLNAVWHNRFDMAGEDIYSPISEAQYEEIKIEAQNLTAIYSYENFIPLMVADNTIQSWAHEGVNFSKGFVYKNYELQLYETLDEEYINYGYEMTKRNIVLAGYRLGDLIVYLYQLKESGVELDAMISSEEGFKIDYGFILGVLGHNKD